MQSTHFNLHRIKDKSFSKVYSTKTRTYIIPCCVCTGNCLVSLLKSVNLNSGICITCLAMIQASLSRYIIKTRIDKYILHKRYQNEVSDLLLNLIPRHLSNHIACLL